MSLFYEQIRTLKVKLNEDSMKTLMELLKNELHMNSDDREQEELETIKEGAWPTTLKTTSSTLPNSPPIINPSISQLQQLHFQSKSKYFKEIQETNSVFKELQTSENLQLVSLACGNMMGHEV